MSWGYYTEVAGYLLSLILLCFRDTLLHFLMTILIILVQKTSLASPMLGAGLWLFHDGCPYHIETSPLICSEKLISQPYLPEIIFILKYFWVILIIMVAFHACNSRFPHISFNRKIFLSLSVSNISKKKMNTAEIV